MIDGAMQDFPLRLDRFLDHAARWHPRREVVTAGNAGQVERIGYAGLRDRSRRISTVLAGLGVGPGEHVATLAWNTQAHVESWYGIMGIGAVCHTLNPRQTASQLGAMATAASDRVLIASADLLPLARALAALAPSIEHVLVIDGEATRQDPEAVRADERALEPLIGWASEPDPAWAQFDERAPAGLCFTSGTTGPPKGVTYTHRASFLHALRLLQTDVIGISAADSVLVVVPMFHACAWGLPFAVPAAGAKLVLPGRQMDGASLAKLIAAEAVTIAVGVPTVWLGLLDHLEATGGTLPSLQRILMGGAPLPPALMARLERRLGVKVQTSWGMTELSPSGTVSPANAPERSAGLSGKPAIGMDLLLTDADGVPLPDQRGPEGHLRVRGASVIERYFGEAEPATDASGWFPTGDLARIDADGNLSITGRAKDLIKSGGEWINPGEIEAIVGAHPDVALAAVIGRPDAKWGERPVLLVETRDGRAVAGETLIETLRGRVASWWLPDTVVLLPAMPLTPTGKIDKIRLRSTYGGG
ncbi:AMP-binding protein [Lichenicola sp.]|uniref:AMP-binding protein n=1 Tax=Lichenicola sp. TaxID=2804529 RepID=UPI003B00AF30